jgi:catechol 2,3-dioxygenase-like lactoylglutathione lyase family enzyme
MRIKLTSVYVDDQEKALRFYTGTLGFVKKLDLPLGEYRWLTVVSPEEPEGTQLLLEPNANPVSKTYQRAVYEQGIGAAMFFVEDARAEYARLQSLGVRFTAAPAETPGYIMALCDDTCGNLIQITQLKR